MRGVVPSFVLGILLAFPSATALAAVGGYEQVVVESPASSASKTVTATCPAGKQVVGAGGFAGQEGGPVPLEGQVLLDGVVPTADLRGVRAEGVEDETGFADSWTVRAAAVCATPPPGLVRVAATSAVDSAAKGVTVACPTGTKVLGAGGETNDGERQVLLRAVRPDNVLKAVNVLAVEDGNGFTGDWSVTAYAICAPAPAGLELVTAQTPPGSSDTEAIAACPAGKRVIAAGGEIVNGSGQVAMDFLVPSPFEASEVIVHGSEDETGFSGNWSVIAKAVCADVTQRVVAQSANNSEAFKVVSASCPGGMAVTGAGADITGGQGEVYLDVLLPDDSPAEAVARGDEDFDGYARSWLVRAYAICASPLAGLERVSVTSSEDNTDKSVSASCPLGKRVVGVGGSLGGATGEAAITAIRPNAALTFVTLEAKGLGSSAWLATVDAICASPPPGLELVAATSDPDSDPTTVIASCGIGKNLLGTGGEIGQTEFDTGRAILEDIRPNALLTNVAVAGVEDQFAGFVDWTVTAYAICASP